MESGISISGLDSENHKVGQGSGSDASKRANSSSGSSGAQEGGASDGQEDAAEDCLSAQDAAGGAQEGGASDDTRSRRVVLHGFGRRRVRPPRTPLRAVRQPRGCG